MDITALLQNPQLVQSLQALQALGAIATPTPTPATPAPTPEADLDHWDLVDNLEKRKSKARKQAVASLPIANEKQLDALRNKAVSGENNEIATQKNQKGGFRVDKSINDQIDALKEKRKQQLNTDDGKAMLAETVLNGEIQGFSIGLPRASDGKQVKNISVI
jgi:hypothetical protein